MSEILGDAEPYREPHADAVRDSDSGEATYYYDDDIEGRPNVFVRAWTSGATAGSLAIASLVLATLSLLEPFTGYVLTEALTASHRSPLFAQRAMTVVELVVAGLAVLGAVFTYRAAVHLDEPASRRRAHVMAGAAILIATVSIIQAVVALVILGGVPQPNTVTG